MELETKFRAKNVLTQKWEIYTLQDLIDGKATGIALDNWCRYTGLKDRQGKEIYEGDIIRYKGQAQRDFINCEINWNNRELGWWLKPIPRQWGKRRLKMTITTICEVIGNVWENPELTQSNN